ncbi:anthranilate phosphoribosyltransferase [Motilibacter aurantiacus]|uniref:anthranilate phosphoribosyltransferase n=1 Tax=Motilibacter aurantiacus TaxID=2714955 RepID=UPI00140D5122|nr:anthranilate phosphoribosyltransferase [Motilibacter aurantiacus]NHC44879.1 anthranilate phosphoribosyltransferase [Motilibacter aurantiacus]
MSPASSRTWPNLLHALLRGEALSADDTAWAMDQVMQGAATPVEIAGFAVALRAKGETPEEVSGLVSAMLTHAQRTAVPGAAVDTCGTGGDRAHTVNISTMSAVVVAAAGGRVVKHGNRAASSRSGSADLLEALGVVVDLKPEAIPACVEEAGIAFCFAPLFHPALRHASVTRRELGVATIFNFLGPLANPAQPAAQAVGVADARMAGVMASVLAARGTSALVFRGEDGLDELTVTGPSRVWEVRGGAVQECTVTPEALGVSRAPAEALRGEDATYNAKVAQRVLGGETGPVRDAVVLNAAAALVALDAVGAEPTAPLQERLKAGVVRAGAAIDSGAAGTTLDRWAAVSQRLGAAS